MDPSRVRESLAIRLMRRMWERRAHSWDSHRSPGLQRVVEAVLEAAGSPAGQAVVDLGCGTGQLALPLARAGARVTAVDVSPRMIELLQAKARDSGIAVEPKVVPIEHLDLPDASVDLVVSNYALHHLHDRDKAAVVRSAHRWLHEGGRIIVGDMMFGRGATPRDRRIIGAKAAAMVGRGPAGWYRLAKNAFRFLLRFQERPVSMTTWVGYLKEAGFVDVETTTVVAEAALVTGTKR